jgi:hypothetical protein
VKKNWATRLTQALTIIGLVEAVALFLVVAYLVSLLVSVSATSYDLVSETAGMLITVQGILLGIQALKKQNKVLVIWTAGSFLLGMVTFMVAKLGPKFMPPNVVSITFSGDIGWFMVVVLYYLVTAWKEPAQESSPSVRD